MAELVRPGEALAFGDIARVQYDARDVVTLLLDDEAGQPLGERLDREGSVETSGDPAELDRELAIPCGVQ